MAHKLVGDHECSFQDVAEIFDNEPMHTTIMLEWKNLANRLNTPQNIVHKHQLDLNMDKLTHIDVVEELLQDWRLRNGKNATIDALLDIIMASYDWPFITGFLQNKIRQYAKGWRDLDKNSKECILNSVIEFQGKKQPLASFALSIGENKLHEILDKTLTISLINSLLDHQQLRLDIFRQGNPNPYYIDRTLTLKRTLDSKVFKENLEDIFVFEAIQHHHLTILAKPELTDVSGVQVDDLTVRFILLDDEDDFKQITDIALHPVHRIRYFNTKFFWVGSVGSVQGIKKYLLDEYEELNESVLVREKLSTFTNQPMAICSRSGMGKSFLLTNLANKLSKTYTNRLVIHLQFSTLLQTIRSICSEIHSHNLMKILASASSLNPLGEQLLLEIMSCNQSQVEIFLDGLDEISPGDLNLVMDFLKVLFKLQNMRAYITTRPHLKNEIEELIGFSGFDIIPFQKGDQIQFFYLYWGNCLGSFQDDKIISLAAKVLEFLTPINEAQPNNEEFSGIPLQCLMLAEIYLEDAKRCLHYSAGQYDLLGATKSLFELYVRFMDSKFQPVSDELSMRKIYWREALDFLFPDAAEIGDIKDVLHECTVIPWEELYTMGIMEKNPVDDKPSFVHRTFAEYLLADFITRSFETNQQIDERIMTKFIYENLLATGQTVRGMELKDALVKKIVDYVETASFWKNTKKDYSPLFNALMYDSNLNLQYMRNDSLDDILIMWQSQVGLKATVDAFLKALNKVGWGELVDGLQRNIIEGDLVLYHSTICFFINAALEKSLVPLPTVPQIEVLPIERFSRKKVPSSLLLKMFTCAHHSYKNLTQLVFELCCKLPQNENNFVNFDPNICSEYLLAAAKNDNLDFFKFVCEVVESFGCIKTATIRFPTNLIDETVYEHTPLHEAIRRGNYMVSEFLMYTYRNRLQDISSLWQVCLYESSNQPRYVVKNKAKILFLLKSKNVAYEFNDEGLEDICLFEVDAELLVTMFDIFVFVPQIRDINYIRMAVHNITNDIQMDVFVGWALSKNLGILLTHQFEKGWSITWDAINRNVMRPEILAQIYKACAFNLSSICSAAVTCRRGEALVKTIVDLSGDVNLTDLTERTILHSAAYFRKPTILKYLLQNGANANLVNRNQDAPLHYVFYDIDDNESFYHIHECVQLLLDYNADCNILNDVGMSALSYAVQRRHMLQIQESTIELLSKKTTTSQPTVGSAYGENLDLGTSSKLCTVKNAVEIDDSVVQRRTKKLECVLS